MPSSEVMHKWKHGQLHSGSKKGPLVKNRKQAIAIMLSEKRAEAAHGGKYPEKNRQTGGNVMGGVVPPLNPLMGAPGSPAPGASTPFVGAPGGVAYGAVTPMAGSPAAMGPLAPNGPSPRQGFNPPPQPADILAQQQGIANPMGGSPGPNPMGGVPGFAEGGVAGFDMAKHAHLAPSKMISSGERRLMHGPVMSAVGGRTDAHKTAVPSGSYVVPADVVSGRGQGNTMAGMQVLSKLFKMGPYGTSPSNIPKPAHFQVRGMKAPKLMSAAAGGVTENGDNTGVPVPVNVAGGELIIPPESLVQTVHPNLETAHDIMDQWVLNERAKLRKTLGKLPGPVKD